MSRMMRTPLLLALMVAAGLTAGWPALQTARAGDGHDHGDAAPAAQSNGPQRLPDGSVFLPKPAQRQMSVRTMPAVDGEHPRAVELAGKVTMDPNAGGKVQPLVAGRIEAGPNGLPSLGQRVRKGEVLAYVVPSAGTLERSSQVAQLAELRAAKSLADKRLQRLRSLPDSVPRKEVEAAESDVGSLGARIAAINGGLATRDTLIAPVSGVISSSHVVAGQVVEARELLFEVMDPNRLRIEALSYDPELAGNIDGATLISGAQAIRLSLIGAARVLREQALPIVFGGEGVGLSALAVGQAVKLTVQTRERIAGIRLPASALMRSPSNQTIVWVKAGPERFEPRTVSIEPLDGAHVAITSGLTAGDRVAVQGASLINQIR